MGTLQATIRASRYATHLVVNSSSLLGWGALAASALLFLPLFTRVPRRG
jgi:hypothetical protein